MPNRHYVAISIVATLGLSALLLLIPGRTDTTWTSIGISATGFVIAVAILIHIFKPTKRIVAPSIQDGNLSTPARRNALASSSEMAQLREGAISIEVVVPSQSNPLRSPAREGLDTAANHPPSPRAVWEQRPADISVARETLRDDHSKRSVESIQVLSSSSPARDDAQKD